MIAVKTKKINTDIFYKPSPNLITAISVVARGTDTINAIYINYRGININKKTFYLKDSITAK